MLIQVYDVRTAVGFVGGNIDTVAASVFQHLLRCVHHVQAQVELIDLKIWVCLQMCPVWHKSDSNPDGFSSCLP